MMNIEPNYVMSHIFTEMCRRTFVTWVVSDQYGYRWVVLGQSGSPCQRWDEIMTVTEGAHPPSWPYSISPGSQ